MVKRQNRVSDPVSNAPRESQRQKGETLNSRISGPDTFLTIVFLGPAIGGLITN